MRYQLSIPTNKTLLIRKHHALTTLCCTSASPDSPDHKPEDSADTKPTVNHSIILILSGKKWKGELRNISSFDLWHPWNFSMKSLKIIFFFKNCWFSLYFIRHCSILICGGGILHSWPPCRWDFISIKLSMDVLTQNP